MNKKILLLLIMLMLLPPIVFSIRTFVIQETEKISLNVNATDPDADKLATSYGAPLDQNGEWQTTYGDAGEYNTSITVSDGVKSVSDDVLIIVKKKEEKPKIESSIPAQENLDVKETESVDFRILADDLNKDLLTYYWFLDGTNEKEGQEFTYETRYGDAGTHFVSAVVSDGTTNVTKEWRVHVGKVDILQMLDSIPDVNANENDVVSLSLPDFEKYGLTYTISEPIGVRNKWQTTFNDSGTYDVKIHAEGKGFIGDKTVKVTINNVDRPLVFDKLDNKVIKENEDLEIELNAYDPDGDQITYFASNMPEGAELNGSIFRWKPSYDTVRKGGLVNWFLEKFGGLKKTFYVQFAASSKDKKILQNVIITVFDVNRAPVIEDIDPITINEGDTVRIPTKAYDLDGDAVKLKYSGFINKDTYKSKLGDAGKYSVKVTASDGKLASEKFADITINHLNRPPVFDKIKDINAFDGDHIALLLNAHDPDGDEINYSIDNPPEDSFVKGNAFEWNPTNFAGRGETKNIDLIFLASDGKQTVRQIAKAQIKHKNKAPKIINATTFISARVNQPAFMSVNAIDEDGDSLTYTWEFSLFEKYKAPFALQRIFTSKGLKTLKVTVSDGIDSVEQPISVNVI